MHLLLTEFGCPEVTQCGWQDIKSSDLLIDSFVCLGPGCKKLPSCALRTISLMKVRSFITVARTLRKCCT